MFVQRHESLAAALSPASLRCSPPRLSPQRVILTATAPFPPPHKILNYTMANAVPNTIGCGLISDVGIIAGINYAADANFRKWLPGVRLSWELPGFAFFNTDFTAYLDDNAGFASGGAPAETDSFMIDINWALPLSIGKHDFSIEGHAEFISACTNEFGNEVSCWILAQPQFRYDLRKTLFDSPKQLFVGIEWQIWPNKLGDNVTDESAVQALAVWRF